MKKGLSPTSIYLKKEERKQWIKMEEKNPKKAVDRAK